MIAGSHAQVASAPLRLVLVADADPDTRDLYEVLLTPRGYAVVQAADGRAALATIFDRHPWLVITETRLPFIDGYDLSRVLRADRSTSVLPIIVVTGDVSAAHEERALRCGASTFLRKPCCPETLFETVEHLTLSATSSPAAPSAPMAKRSATLPFSESRAGTPHRVSRRKAWARFQTATPPAMPPLMRCPSCDHVLRYQHSYIGGVNDRSPEQWDYFECDGCDGRFEYRHRTRKARPA